MLKLRPLVLDLDGTLIKTDIVHEMLFRLLYTKPSALLRVPFWFLKGRAYAKARLTEITDLTPPQLPYNSTLISFAKKEAKTGRPIILATGTNQKMAQNIANHVGIFQDVIGSTAHINMVGPNKQKALVARFGSGGFDYAGDSRVDTPIWRVSHNALVVHPEWGALKSAQSVLDAKRVSYFPRKTSRLWAFVLALRPLFWACNFVDPSWTLFLALSSFTPGLLMAGDLTTLYKERTGTHKKSVFAEGDLSLPTAFFLIPLLTLFPLLFFPHLFFYFPLFMGADLLTRTIALPLRWFFLSLIQISVPYFLFIGH